MDTPHQTLKRAQEYRTVFLDYLQIVLGTFLMALSFAIFFLPRDIAPGGITGLATIIASFWATNVGLLSFMINLPLFAAGWKVVSLRFAIRSFLAMTLLSVFIDILPHVDISGDMMLASVFGGIVEGVGLGLVVRGGATTGGTDMAAQMVHRHWPFLSIGMLIMLLDGMVVCIAGWRFGLPAALWALITVAVTSFTTDMVVKGFNTAMQFLIISSASDRITSRIHNELGRGCTRILAKGTFSKQDVGVLLCVVSRVEVFRLRQLIAEEDEHAFVTISDVQKAMGEGFDEIRED